MFILELVFPPHFLKIMLEVKASGRPNCLKLWLVVGKCMLPVEYFCTTKPPFVFIKFNGDHMTTYNDEVKSGHPQFWRYYWI